MTTRLMPLSRAAVPALVLVLSAAPTVAQRPPRPAQKPPARAGAPAAFFTTPLSLAEMAGKQAVLETASGTIVSGLLPEAAPNHVGYFITTARDGGYDGTVFHRVVRGCIIQGGDPLSRDPARRDQFGTGGLGVLRLEASAERHTTGAVSAVLRPGQPDSGGAQFFICLTDQPALDGAYSVFGRVVEGLEVAMEISAGPPGPDGKVADPVVIRRVTIRDAPPPQADPFTAESVEELAQWRAVLQTSLGEIGLAFFPEKAPAHVRNFLRLASLGVYDGMAFHRGVPGFVAQTGALTSRSAPLTAKQQRFVTEMAPEFNDTRHLRGILSMARGSDPGSATTSFFICFGPAPSLDGKYTAFGHVVSGLDVLDAIEKAPLSGETPVTPITLQTVRLERAGG
jgi:peptidyl-prolyl cis-trans isomerase B (cyclophilin B)